MEVIEHTDMLQECYPDDMEKSFSTERESFKSHLESSNKQIRRISPLQMRKSLREDYLTRRCVS